MKPGSVIVDMAAANGGNCPLTEADKVVTKHGVKLVGITNFPALCPTDASHFFAQNMVNLLDVLWNKERTELALADDIVAASLVGDLDRVGILTQHYDRGTVLGVTEPGDLLLPDPVEAPPDRKTHV